MYICVLYVMLCFCDDVVGLLLSVVCLVVLCVVICSFIVILFIVGC